MRGYGRAGRGADRGFEWSFDWGFERIKSADTGGSYRTGAGESGFAAIERKCGRAGAGSCRASCADQVSARGSEELYRKQSDSGHCEQFLTCRVGR